VCVKEFESVPPRQGNEKLPLLIEYTKQMAGRTPIQCNAIKRIQSLEQSFQCGPVQKYQDVEEKIQLYNFNQPQQSRCRIFQTYC